ncbi:hypothetical protein CBR_g20013 [Chara braunii]|uniref:Magnesium transporter n=1 Tax=Chara braunii TaxID=69332 RepID=A0A388KZK6_CHABU|nr:hypothetical protein CBR_g20013 [Chara braunii]|eukprot:GBG75383.1 hypothetical protein CBR_g20013 [Chara braunii]
MSISYLLPRVRFSEFGSVIPRTGWSLGSSCISNAALAGESQLAGSNLGRRCRAGASLLPCPFHGQGGGALAMAIEQAEHDPACHVCPPAGLGRRLHGPTIIQSERQGWTSFPDTFRGGYNIPPCHRRWSSVCRHSRIYDDVVVLKQSLMPSGGKGSSRISDDDGTIWRERGSTTSSAGTLSSSNIITPFPAQRLGAFPANFPSPGWRDSIGIRRILEDDALAAAQSRVNALAPPSGVAAAAAAQSQVIALAPPSGVAAAAAAESQVTALALPSGVAAAAENTVPRSESSRLSGMASTNSSNSSSSRRSLDMHYYGLGGRGRRKVGGCVRERDAMPLELSAMVPRLNDRRCFGAIAGGVGLPGPGPGPGPAISRKWPARKEEVEAEEEGKRRTAIPAGIASSTLYRVSQQLRRVCRSSLCSVSSSTEDAGGWRFTGWWGRESEGKLENVVGGGGGVDEGGGREVGSEGGGDGRGGGADSGGGTKEGAELSGKPSTEDLLKDRQLQAVLMQGPCNLLCIAPILTDVPKDEAVAVKTKVGGITVRETAVLKTAAVETAAVETAAAKTGPVETGAMETAAVETATVETAAVETAAVETTTVDTAAVDTAGVETAAVETAGVETAAVETASTSSLQCDQATNSRESGTAGSVHEAGRASGSDSAARSAVEAAAGAGGVARHEAAWLKRSASQPPFEMRMLECMLENVVHGLKLGYVELGPEVAEVLGLFVKAEGQEVFIDDQRRLLRLRNRLLRFNMKVNQISSALKELLANDEDMAQLYLTRKAELGGEVRTHEHSEVEELLENYYKQVEEVVNEVETMLSTIDATGEYLRTVLDSLRNELIRMDVMLNMTTCSLAAGGVLAGVFGSVLAN